MKNQTYNVFWQRIYKHARGKLFPLRVMFELTYRCNFFCPHCYIPSSYREKSKKGELKTKQVFSILDQLKDIGCFYLGFTGGEPFIREDIMKILWYAKRCGFELIIYTNGSLINEKIASQLEHLRPNKIDITIPAMSKNGFERISGVSGSRDKVFKTINLLHKKEVSLGFKTSILKENESEIGQIQDFAHSLGALHRLNTMLMPRLDGSKKPYKYRGKLRDNLVTSHKSQVTSKGELIDCNLETTNRKPQTDNLFKCGVGVSQAAITPFGELKMCLMIDYPKYRLQTRDYRPQTRNYRLQKMSLKDAWEKLKESVTSIKPNKDYKCDECELEPFCKWCPAIGWLENRNFTSCDPESRRWAELRKKSYEDRS